VEQSNNGIVSGIDEDYSLNISFAIRSIVLWFIALIVAAGFSVALMTIIRDNFLTRGLDMRVPVDQTISICGLSAFIAVLITWKWVSFSSVQNRILRIPLAFLMLAIVFGAIGGILVIVNNYWNYEGPDRIVHWNLLFHSFYWESVNGFYSFALFMIGELRWQMLLVFLIVSFCIATLSPMKKPETVKFGKLKNTD